MELRAVRESDLDFFCRFDTEPGLIGPNWYGFRDAGRHRRRFETDGWLGEEDGRLTTQPENTAEQRSLQKIGFRHEGVLRGAEFRDGTWRDVVVFGLLRGEQAPS